MAVVVVKVRSPSRESARCVKREADRIADWMTAVGLAAAAAGPAIVFASMLGGPVWLRACLIALGALVGTAGLAVLAADAASDATRRAVSGRRPSRE